MTGLIINKKWVDGVEVTPVQPEGDQLPQPTDPAYNLPLTDEIFLKVASEKGRPPRFYIARLQAKTDLSVLKKGSAVTIVEGEERLRAEVIWKDDESPQTAYAVSRLKIDFGYPNVEGDPTPPPKGALDFDAAALKKEIAKELKIKKGDKLTAAKWEKLLVAIKELTEDYEDEVLEAHLSANQDGNSLELKLLLVPPPQTVRPEFMLATGDPLPEADQERLRQDIIALFDTPLIREAIEEGQKELLEYFRNSPDYFMATDEEGRILLGRAYSKEGNLEVYLGLLPVPKAIEFDLVEVDANNNKVREAHFPPGSKLPAKLTYPLSEANMEKNIEALLKAYGEQGFVANIVPRSLSREKAVYGIILAPAPKKIAFVGNTSPKTGELEKMFSENGRYTTISIQKGEEALRQWYAEKGYRLPGGQPMVKVVGTSLHIEAHAATLRAVPKISYVYYKDKAKKGMGVKVPLDEAVKRGVIDETTAQNLMKELEQTTVGELFDLHALNRAIARLKSGYPLEVKPERDVRINYNPEDNSVAPEIIVRDVSPRFEGSFGGGVSDIEGIIDDADFSVSASGGLRLKSGKKPAASLGYFQSGENKIFTAGASLYIPWFNNSERGTSATFGVTGTIVADGSDYNHSVTPYATFDIPFKRHSPWGIITGVSVEGLITPGDGYKTTWINPDIGIRYYTPLLNARLVTGPRVDLDGEFFWETTARAIKIFPLTERLHLDVLGSGGTQRGDVPDEKLFRGLDFPIAHEGLSGDAGTKYAGVSLDLRRDFGRGWLTVSPGVGGSVRIIDTPYVGPVVETGAGASLQLLRGINLYLGPRWRLIDETLEFSPLEFGVAGAIPL